MLYEVQLQALRAAHGKSKFAYFMEQGLGKTRTILSEFENSEDLRRLIVICPNSFKGGWVAEANTIGFKPPIFVYTPKSVQLMHKFAKFHAGRKFVIVVNYESMRTPEVSNFLVKLGGAGSMICADESIYLKNPQSATTKVGLMLAKAFEYRRILSGKPITQGPHDLWGQLRFIGLLDGINFFSFRNRFCAMGGYMGKKIVGAMNEEHLKEIMNPHVFKARKVDWTDLPEKIYTTREITLPTELRKPYEEMQEEFLTEIHGTVVTADQIITKLIKMAQIQSGFVIDEEGKVHELVPVSANPKLQVMLEIMEQEVEGKAIIGCVHKHSVDMVKRAFSKYNPAWLTGGMKTEEIEEQKRRFNEDPTCRVFVANIHATKYGHTLLGDAENRCATTMFFENVYSLDARSQFEDRNHRHGQDRGVLYLDFVGTDLDRQIIKALQRKEDLAARLLDYSRETGVLPGGEAGGGERTDAR